MFFPINFCIIILLPIFEGSIALRLPRAAPFRPHMAFPVQSRAAIQRAVIFAGHELGLPTEHGRAAVFRRICKGAGGVGSLGVGKPHPQILQKKKHLVKWRVS